MMGKNINDAFLIIIKARKGTKGISINGEEVGIYANQCEWLLNENVKYITNCVDEKNHIIEIELI